MRCLAIDETAVLIEQSIHELQIEIDDKIPNIGKYAYLHSQLTAKRRSFVNSKEFRLRFLRFELFDIKKTAIRMLKWLDLALSLFGSIALERPICISTNFSSDELRFFRKGYIQLLPVRASGTGRRIICFIPYDEDWYALSSKQVILKIMMYIFWTVGNDIDAQRKGVATVFLFDPSFPQIPHHKGAGVISPSDQWMLSVRMSAIHVCTPDTPFFKLTRRFIAMAIGPHNRLRLRLHLGTSVEFHYSLQVYGIPIELIPMTYTGKIKLLFTRQWLRLRRMIEDKVKLPANIVVEAPYLNDVLFKQGNSFPNHPGNNMLRNLVEAKAKQLLEVRNNKPSKKKEFLLEILDAIETVHRGRFLYWHKRDDMTDYWWVLLYSSDTNDEQVLLSKIEPLFRKTYTKMQQQQQQQQQGQGQGQGQQHKLMYTTHNMMQQRLIHRRMHTGPNNSNRNERTRIESIINEGLTIADPPIMPTMPISTTSATINQTGGTFPFHSLDGNKRNNTHRRVSLEHNDNSSSSSGDDNNDIPSSEFFGMKFIPSFHSLDVNKRNNIHSRRISLEHNDNSSSSSSSGDDSNGLPSSECFGMQFFPCSDYNETNPH